MRVVIACPDRHLVYDAGTPDETGVGGGVTVRIRAAAALAKRGHHVTLVCNCRKASVQDGVQYVPLDMVPALETDVLLLHSSGGAVDVAPAAALPVSAKVRVVLVSNSIAAGTPESYRAVPLKGIAQARPDAFYLPSNFLRRHVKAFWGIAPEKTFVTYHGVTRPERRLDPGQRNQFRLLYPSHPSKGLDAALGVWRRLRSVDERFELEICGGDRLWGGAGENRPAPEPGLIYSGLLGQRALFERFERAGFVVQLQEVQEAFGISVAEGMAAGCIVVASPVGSYVELVRHGLNGFLIPGPHQAAETQARAADLILDLTHHPDAAGQIRRKAASTPLDWDDVVQTWAGHWEWLMHGKPELAESTNCAECGGQSMRLADGDHCVACGNYAREK